MIKNERIFLAVLSIVFFCLNSVAQSSNKVPSDTALPRLSPEIEKIIKDNTPVPLPQDAAVYKERSDAEENLLKGKVKTVIEQMKVLSGGGADAGIFFNGITEYDRRGNRLSEIRFANEGQPTDVIAYGYIDGFRVSKSNFIPKSTGRLVIVGEKPVQNSPTQHPDDRYTSKYVYTYKGGRLVEMHMYQNDGSRSMRYTYEYSPDSNSKSGYDPVGEINSKYVLKLDKDGNEIQQTSIDVRKVYGRDIVSLIENEKFDSAGNWTQRTWFQTSTEDGKLVRKSLYTEYRTIYYY
jgi:hypothetical protein